MAPPASTLNLVALLAPFAPVALACSLPLAALALAVALRQPRARAEREQTELREPSATFRWTSPGGRTLHIVTPARLGPPRMFGGAWTRVSQEPQAQQEEEPQVERESAQRRKYGSVANYSAANTLV